MFNVVKLTPSQIDFLTSLQNGGRSRSKEISFALAYAISSALSLPSSPVDNLTIYYNSQVRLDVEALVSAINEVVILDTQEVRELCFRLYSVRYTMLFPELRVHALCPETAIEDIFRITRFVDNDTLKVVKTECVRVSNAYNAFVQIVQAYMK